MKKWILALLIFVIVMIGIAIGMVNMISGTTPVHKQALEKAFSDALGGDVKFKTLVAFNVAPQFIMEADGITMQALKKGGSGTIKKFKIAFGFEDLVFSRRRIEEFEINNLDLTGAVPSLENFTIITATIENPDKGDIAYLMAQGSADAAPFLGRIRLKVFDGGRKSFAMEDSNEAHFEFGKITVDGQFKPFAETGATLSALVIKYDGQDCTIDPAKEVPFNEVVGGFALAAIHVKNAADFDMACALLQNPQP